MMKKTWQFAAILACSLGFASAGLSSARAGEEPGDAATPAKSDAPTAGLATQQQQVGERFRELEKLLLRMAELTAPTDPRRAALLRQAVAQSKERDIDHQFEALVDLLRQDRMSLVVKSQGEVHQDLVKLLELLLSEDRSKHIQSEKERIREYLRRVNKIIKEQKGIQGETSRQGDQRKLADRQGDVSDKTAELAENIGENQTAKSSQKSNPKQQGKGQPDGQPQDPGQDDGEQKDADKQDKDAGKQDSGKDSDGDSHKKDSDEKDSDEKKDPGADKKDGNPQDGEQKDADQKDAQQGKKKGQKGSKQGGKKSDKSKQDDADESAEPEKSKKDADKNKEGEDKKSAPEKRRRPGGQEKNQDGKPQEGEPGEPSPGQPGQPSDGEPSQGSGEPSEQSPPEDSPAQKRLQQAQQRMKEAQKKLEEAKREEATEKQAEAIKELEQAKADLEEILRQLREEETARTLAMLESRFRKMLDQQVEVYEGTQRLDKVPEAQRDRDDEIEAGRLSRKETEIANEAEKALAVLHEEGSAVAFPEAVGEMRDDMLQVRDRLAETKVGDVTQGLEKDVIAGLEEMVAALQKAQKEMDAKAKAGQPAPDGDSEPPLVDTLSELKMIRALQMRVNLRTQRYAEMTKIEQKDTPELLEALKRLAEREQRIHQVTRDIAMGRNQ